MATLHAKVKTQDNPYRTDYLTLYTDEGVGGNWGEIQGDIEDQTDLQEALDAKLSQADITSSLTSSSTNSQAAGAKAVYDGLAEKSSVSVSASGTATDEVKYITVNGVEKKIGGGDTTELEQILSYALNRLEEGKMTRSQVVALLGDIELVASAALNDLEQRKIINNLAPEFHPWDAAVNVGELRVYKGVLYRCTTQTTAGRPFTPSEWTRTTIAAEMITTN